MKEFYKASNDAVFKTIFTKDSNRDLLKRLLKDILGIDVKIILLKVPELPKNKAINRGKVLDILVETSNGLINIEVNNYKSFWFHRRNMAFVCKSYSDYSNIGQSYDIMPKIIQINLSSEITKDMPYKSVYKLYDEENNQYFVDNFEIMEINLAKAKEMCYNGLEKSLVGLLDCNLEELNQVKGDEQMEELKKQVRLLNENDEFPKLMSDEDEARLAWNTEMNEARREGLEQGIQQGIEQGIEQGLEQGIEQTAKNMLNKNTDIKFISEVTGLSIEEIEKLK